MADKATDQISAKALGVPDSYVPEGYESAAKFLEYVLKVYEADVGADKDNRLAALEDLEFVAGDQWDPDVKADRIARRRPCMTVNVLPQFIGQVIGDRRMNKAAIKVRPFKDGTAEVAEVRSGLIKSIEAFSRADRAYDAACEDQVACGIGNLRVDMEYAANDVFEQDLFVRHIPNPLAVVWDRMSVDPTGRDARHCFVEDSIPKEVFEANYPDAPLPSALSDGTTRSGTTNSSAWYDGKVVRMTEFWELVDKPATIALTASGKVVDITGKEEDPNTLALLFVDPVTQQPKTRKTVRTYARMHLVSGHAVLSEAYELPLTRLPIVRVEGRVVRVGENRVRFGLTRFAKDSQRLKNYWRSVAAETLALAPKAQWIAPDDAVAGREAAWRESHATGDSLLIFNKNASAEPQRVDPPAFPAALVQEAQLNQQDIKDTTGLHDASLGIQSNEVSGRAIDSRKREGDVATIIYHDNVNNAIQEVGDILNQLIPLAYDTTRTVRVIGEDDKHKLISINDPNNDNSIDITMGKYDVSLETGPSFTTQRQEAQEGMLALIQTNPDLMSVIGDLVAEGMDWPKAHEIAERIRRSMPPQLTQDPDSEDQSEGGEQPQVDPQMAAQQQAQEMQLQEAQAQLEHAAQMRQVELAEAEARAKQAEANARKAEADAEAAEANAHRAAVETAYAPVKQEQALVQTHEQHGQRMQHNERAQRSREQQQRNQPRPGGNAKGAPKKENKP